MRFCLLLTSYCLLVFTSSCKPKTDYTKEIARLDSAATALKNAEINFISADTNAFRSAFAFSQKKLQFISEKVSKDTVKKKLAILLSDAYEHTGNLQNILENKKFLQRALTEGRQRINDLKHDLAADLIEKNKSLEYVVNEIESSRKLSEAANKTVEKAKTAMLKLDSLKTKITALADSLNSK